MGKKVIFGGTFNPFHAGHMAVCDYFLKNNPDCEIIIIPVANPPHKSPYELTSAEDRLAMIEAATKDNDRIIVSDYEIKKGGKSYTYDTISHFNSIYPNERFSFIMGSDMYFTFHEWKNWKELGKMMDICVVLRDSDDRKRIDDYKNFLLGEGIESEIIKSPIKEISSTEIRVMFGENVKDLLPAAVYDYIKEHNLYKTEDAEGELMSIIKPLMREKRYIHSCNVAKRAYQLACIHGCDRQKALVAGYLHDICKHFELEESLQILNTYDTITDIDFRSNPHLLHGFSGAVYVENIVGVHDPDIINAIRYHTTARGGMSKLEQIIYLADLTSVERDYPDVDYVREISEKSIDEAMLYCLRYITDKLKREDGFICGYTIDALKEYEAKCCKSAEF